VRSEKWEVRGVKCEVRGGRGREYRASIAARVFGDGGEGSPNSNWSAAGRWMERLVGEENHPPLPNEVNDECFFGADFNEDLKLSRFHSGRTSGDGRCCTAVFGLCGV